MDMINDTQSLKSWSKTQQKAILALWNRPYWKRVWVVQEVLLAKDIIVICGNHICLWQSFLDTLHRAHDIRRMPSQSQQHMRQTPARRLLQHKAKWKTNDWRRSLHYLIETYSEMEATDARDKVYGLLGLVDGESILADYSLTTEQVYARILDSELAKLDNKGQRRFCTKLRQALGLGYRKPSLQAEISKTAKVRQGS